MRKLLSTLAALAVLATCNVQLAVAQSTVPMVMTLHGDGTITGDLTGHLYGDGELDLTAPALTGAAVAGSFTGTCDAAHILFGDGSCKALNSSLILGTFTGTCNSTNILYGNGSCAAPPAVTSSQVTGAFTGTCNSGTYLNGGGSCTAPIITAHVASTQTCSGGGGQCPIGLNFTGLSTSTVYGLNCFLEISGNSGGQVGVYLANGSGYAQFTNTATTTVTGSAVALSSGQINFNPPSAAEAITLTAWANLAIGTLEVVLNSPSSGNTITVTAGSYCTLVKP